MSYKALLLVKLVVLSVVWVSLVFGTFVLASLLMREVRPQARGNHSDSLSGAKGLS